MASESPKRIASSITNGPILNIPVSIKSDLKMQYCNINLIPFAIHPSIFSFMDKS